MRINLSKREIVALSIISGFLCLFVLFQFIFFPLIEKKERLQRSLQVKLQTIEKMRDLKAKYETILKTVEMSKVAFTSRETGFTLFSFLDTLAGNTNLKDHITYMKPSTITKKELPYKISGVEMKLQQITLEQLASYLYKIETSANMVSIKAVSISKTSRPPGFLDATLNVETFEEI